MSEQFSFTVRYVSFRQMHSTDLINWSVLLSLCFTTGKQRCISYPEVKEEEREKRRAPSALVTSSQFNLL